MAKAFYENLGYMTANEHYRIERRFRKHPMLKSTCFVGQGRTDSYDYGVLLDFSLTVKRRLKNALLGT